MRERLEYNEYHSPPDQVGGNNSGAMAGLHKASGKARRVWQARGNRRSAVARGGSGKCGGGKAGSVAVNGRRQGVSTRPPAVTLVPSSSTYRERHSAYAIRRTLHTSPYTILYAFTFSPGHTIRYVHHT